MAQNPAADSRNRRRSALWRIGTPLVLVLSGGLFLTSAINSEGTDLRPGRYDDLASVVSGESQEVEEQRADAADLNHEVQNLTAQVGSREVEKINRRVENVDGPAQFQAVSGEGLTITLADAPEEVFDTSKRDPNLLLVHQQDIQAVVNALWLGGAKGITVQDQRLITTTGIKCSGNAVRLHGIPYAQPYKITAVGDQDALYAAVMNSHYLQIYREAAALPDVAVGWDLRFENSLTLPGYDGPMELNYAKPLA